jgi:hypothetical protein
MANSGVESAGQLKSRVKVWETDEDDDYFTDRSVLSLSARMDDATMEGSAKV